MVGGARLSRQAGVGRLRARRLRRRERGAARGGPERALRGPGGRRRAGIAGRVRLGPGDPVPRLRPHRGEPEAARRLLGHHRSAHRGPPEGGARDDLRERAPRSGERRGDDVHEGAASRRARRWWRGRGSARSGRPVGALDPRRPRHTPARRRLPLASHADDGNTMGDRARGLDPLLRGRPLPAVLRRRAARPAGARGKARRRRGRRRGADGEVRLGRRAPRFGLGALALDRGRPRRAARAARRPGDLRPPARPREAPGRAAARRHVHARRRRADAHGRRAGAFADALRFVLRVHHEAPKNPPTRVRTGGPGGPGGSDHAYANSAPSSRISATT